MCSFIANAAAAQAVACDAHTHKTKKKDTKRRREKPTPEIRRHAFELNLNRKFVTLTNLPLLLSEDGPGARLS